MALLDAHDELEEHRPATVSGHGPFRPHVLRTGRHAGFSWSTGMVQGRCTSARGDVPLAEGPALSASFSSIFRARYVQPCITTGFCVPTGRVRALLRVHRGHLLPPLLFEWRVCALIPGTGVPYLHPPLVAFSTPPSPVSATLLLHMSPSAFAYREPRIV